MPGGLIVKQWGQVHFRRRQGRQVAMLQTLRLAQHLEGPDHILFVVIPAQAGMRGSSSEYCGQPLRISAESSGAFLAPPVATASCARLAALVASVVTACVGSAPDFRQQPRQARPPTPAPRGQANLSIRGAIQSRHPHRAMLIAALASVGSATSSARTTASARSPALITGRAGSRRHMGVAVHRVVAMRQQLEQHHAGFGVCQQQVLRAGWAWTALLATITRP